MPSFDIVSKIDAQSLDNAINVAKKEILNRYDFHDSKSSIELDKKLLLIHITTENEMRITAIEDVIRSFEEVNEYRVEVKTSRSMEELNVQIEPSLDCSNTKNLCENMEQALRTAFSLRIPVTALPFGSLPRFEMKAKRWIKV